MSTAKLKVARPETDTLENENCRSTQPSTKNIKNSLDASIASTPQISHAAKFNARTLRKLQAAVDDDPEVNLMEKLPFNYATRVVAYQAEARERAKKSIGETRPDEWPIPTQG